MAVDTREGRQRQEELWLANSSIVRTSATRSRAERGSRQTLVRLGTWTGCAGGTTGVHVGGGQVTRRGAAKLHWTPLQASHQNLNCADNSTLRLPMKFRFP